MKIEILFRTQALLNLASAGPAACLFLIVGPGWSCRWRLCRSDRTLNTLTLVEGDAQKPMANLPGLNE